MAWGQKYQSDLWLLTGGWDKEINRKSLLIFQERGHSWESPDGRVGF